MAARTGPCVPWLTVTIDDVEQQQIRDLLRELRVAESWMDQELPQVEDHSALWTDNQRTHPHDVSQGITHGITVAVDHLHAMRMSLTGAGPERIDLHAHAPFTLLRAALENTCTALWIAGAPSRGERILRRLRLHAKSLKHYEQMLKARGVDCTAEVTARRNRLQQVADTNGISAATLNAQLQPTEILKTVGRQLCDEPDDQTLVWQLWSLCSAFAHGDWWVMPLLDNEILGPVSPGVSRVRQTAPTQLVLDTTREILHLANESRAHYARLGMRHVGP